MTETKYTPAAKPEHCTADDCTAPIYDRFHFRWLCQEHYERAVRHWARDKVCQPAFDGTGVHQYTRPYTPRKHHRK